MHRKEKHFKQCLVLSADVFFSFAALLLTTLPQTKEQELNMSHSRLSVSAKLHSWFCTFALVVLVQPQVKAIRSVNSVSACSAFK